MVKKHQQEEARRLRTQGWTLQQIADKLGVAKSSVSMWVRDVKLTDEQREALYGRAYMLWSYAGARANRQKHLKLREQYQQEGRAKAREGRSLHMAGCMLYWAEGAKDRNNLYFVNSDPYMLLFYMRFLREELDVADDEASIVIHCHHETDIPLAEAYWMDLLQLPESSLCKTQVKKGSNTRHNILKYGVCGVRVSKTQLVMHVYGAIQEYAGFDNPDWLF